MPTTEHELPLLLLRERPEVLVRLLEDGLGLSLPAHRTIRIRETDFTQIVPTEYRADLVVTLEADAPVAALVIEPQLSRDEGKRFSWPLYVAALHAKERCPTWLVVLAGGDEVARWAGRPIDTFQPGSRFCPLVLAPRDVPRITSIDEAAALPELAVLSARAHGNDPDGVEVLIATIAGLMRLRNDDTERGTLYLDMVMRALGQAARELLETEMQTRGYEYQSEFARRYYAQGHDEGRIEALRQACQSVLQTRIGSVPEEIATRLERIDDVAVLDRLLRELATVVDADGARAALDHVVSG